MSYTKKKLEKLYNTYLPKDYASRISFKTKFSQRWVREVRSGKASNEEIEAHLLKMVRIGIQKNKKRLQKINSYAKL